MTHLIAVHLDLRDVQSARVWGWIRALGLQAEIEARPFSLDVAEPWDCDGPTFGLELLVLMEQVFFGVPVIAGARSAAGFSAQVGLGALWGLVYAAIAGARR